MFEEDDRPRAKAEPTLNRDLRTLSVADLEGYITAMEAEIARVRAELARRRDVRGAAEALFRKAPAEDGPA